MKVIIAGGRDFNNYELLYKTCNKLLSGIEVKEIVSGGAPNGADSLGEKFAKEKGFHIKVFKANWKYGRAAGPIRNKEMAQYADYLIAFWDGKSKGTKSMINLAKSFELKVSVCKY